VRHGPDEAGAYDAQLIALLTCHRTFKCGH